MTGIDPAEIVVFASTWELCRTTLRADVMDVLRSSGRLVGGSSGRWLRDGAVIAAIRNPQISLAELMAFIPGPDLPGGGPSDARSHPADQKSRRTGTKASPGPHPGQATLRLTDCTSSPSR